MQVLKIAKFDTNNVVVWVINKRQTKNMHNNVHNEDWAVCEINVGIKSRNFASSSYILTSNSGYYNKLY